MSGLLPSPLPPPVTRRGRPLTDRGAVVLAGAVAAGAWVHQPFPVWLAATGVASALVARVPWLLVVAASVLASGLGAEAMAGLGPPPRQAFEGTVTLLADPEPMAFGVHVDVRAGHRRFELFASGGAGGTIAQGMAGERFRVHGRLGPSRPHSPWLVPRHVAGRLDVDRADLVDRGGGPWRVANRFRRILGRGAEVIPEPARALYSGFVLGDDRAQRPEQVDDFRGAGLTHLLVVSGQNVAFVLVLAGPLIDRLGLRARWLATVLVILAFATVTRFEPSVLRASAMAVVAASAVLTGRPTATLRVLAVAMTVLLLVDPLLVMSVGFQLSVAASAGIALWSRRIARALPGPRTLANALGVTLAAQLGVAPILVPHFGGMPVVAIPANVLAVPVAGLVTTWGLPAGFVAGLVGGPVARLLHLPTRVLIWWVAGVARIAAGVPLGELGAVAIGLAVVGGVVAARRRSTQIVRWAGLALLAAVLVLPAVRLRSPPVDQVVGGGRLHRAGGASVLVVEGVPRIPDLMEGLRRSGARRLDVVVTRGPAREELVRALRHRWPVGTFVDAGAGPRATAVGGLRIEIDATGSVLVTEP